jgi:hypothetical protein
MKLGTKYTVPTFYIGQSNTGVHAGINVYRPKAVWMNGRFWSPSVDGTVYSNLADPSVTDANVLKAGIIHTAGWQENYLKYYNKPNYNNHGSEPWGTEVATYNTLYPKTTGGFTRYSVEGAHPVRATMIEGMTQIGSFSGNIIGFRIDDGYTLKVAEILVVLQLTNSYSTISSLAPKIALGGIKSDGTIVHKLLEPEGANTTVNCSAVFAWRAEGDYKFFPLPVVCTKNYNTEGLFRVFMFYGFEAA